MKKPNISKSALTGLLVFSVIINLISRILDHLLSRKYRK